MPRIRRAQAVAADLGHHPAFVGSVCGTASDPQDLARQEAALRQAGVLLADSNAQAARLAARIASRDGARR